jgi:hypothetical protein
MFNEEISSAETRKGKKNPSEDKRECVYLIWPFVENNREERFPILMQNSIMKDVRCDEH